jgi:hypothetical protein
VNKEEKEISESDGEIVSVDDLSEELADAEDTIAELEEMLTLIDAKCLEIVRGKDLEIQMLKDELEGVQVANVSSDRFSQEIKRLKNERRWDLFKSLITEECFVSEANTKSLVAHIDKIIGWYGEK